MTADSYIGGPHPPCGSSASPCISTPALRDPGRPLHMRKKDCRNAAVLFIS